MGTASQDSLFLAAVDCFLPLQFFAPKLLQRLLDDRKATVEIIQAEGGRIAQSAEPGDREKIVSQLDSLGSRWAGLLSRAAAR